MLSNVRIGALIGISSLKSGLSLYPHLSPHCGRLKRAENSLPFLPLEGGVYFFPINLSCAVTASAKRVWQK